ncbi:MAG TPA: QsdR family transcriptional regulator [Frankiaceae bacterium]|nr:QsdR family transcriptional regulator [Frankiaceae bacterium]
MSRTLRLDGGNVTGGEPTSSGGVADLARLLPEGTARPPSIPETVFDAALRRVGDLQRLDMRALAAELGVGRATLYRWVGSRDALLGEVFWWRARRSHARAARASVGLAGRARILTSLQTFLTSAQSDAALHRFLATEPEVALRVLTSQAARVQAGSIAVIERLLAEETDAGRLTLVIDRSTLAYVIVRICESFLYADVIAGREGDIDQAIAVIGQLLGPAAG